MGRMRASDGGKRAVHRGEHVISRKAIAQGVSDVLRCPVCSCAHFLCTLRMRPRVQRASGIPCALFISEGERFLPQLGRTAPRERETVLRMYAALKYHPRHPEVRALRRTCAAGRASKDESATDGPSSFEARRRGSHLRMTDHGNDSSDASNPSKRLAQKPRFLLPIPPR